MQIIIVEKIVYTSQFFSWCKSLLSWDLHTASVSIIHPHHFS